MLGSFLRSFLADVARRRSACCLILPSDLAPVADRCLEAASVWVAETVVTGYRSQMPCDMRPQLGFNLGKAAGGGQPLGTDRAVGFHLHSRHALPVSAQDDIINQIMPVIR